MKKIATLIILCTCCIMLYGQGKVIKVDTITLDFYVIRESPYSSKDSFCGIGTSYSVIPKSQIPIRNLNPTSIRKVIEENSKRGYFTATTDDFYSLVHPVLYARKINASRFFVDPSTYDLKNLIGSQWENLKSSYAIGLFTGKWVRYEVASLSEDEKRYGKRFKEKASVTSKGYYVFYVLCQNIPNKYKL